MSSRRLLPAAPRERRARDLLDAALGLALFQLASGLYLGLARDPELAVYAVVVVHIRAGLVAWVLALAGWLSLPPTCAALGTRVAGAALPALAVPGLVASASFVPMESALALLALVVGGAALVAARRATGARRLAISAWAALAVILPTGFYLGVFRSLGTISNALQHAHGAATAWLAATLALAAARAPRPATGLAAWHPVTAVFLALPLAFTLVAQSRLERAAGPPSTAPITARAELERPAATCGVPECHLEPYQQWKASSHRFSATNETFRAALADRPAADAATCAPCHVPLAARPDEGVGCAVCHTLDEALAPIGGGRYRLRPPTPYLARLGADRDRFAALEESLTYLWVRPHRASYMRPPRKQPELCAPCHQWSADEAGQVWPGHADDTYASWRRSSFAAAEVGCRECHLLMFEHSWNHPPWDHHVHGRDASLAARIPAGHPDRGAVEDADLATVAWLEGILEVRPSLNRYLQVMGDPQVATYRDHYRGRPVLDLEITALVPEGDTGLAVEVTRTSARLGHAFPPTAVRRRTLELVVELVGDADGAVRPPLATARHVVEVGPERAFEPLWQPGSRTTDVVRFDSVPTGARHVRARWTDRLAHATEARELGHAERPLEIE